MATGILVAQSSKQFPHLSSPGATIAAAAKGTAEDRQKISEDAQRGQSTGPVEILSDTEGVDFGPYLQKIMATIRRNWYALIPQDAKHAKGNLAIEFKVHKDGRISDLKLITSAGADLDGPAWGGIEAASPLPALPGAYHRAYLALRCHFLYNPDKSDLQEVRSGANPPL